MLGPALLPSMSISSPVAVRATPQRSTVMAGTGYLGASRWNGSSCISSDLNISISESQLFVCIYSENQEQHGRYSVF